MNFKCVSIRLSTICGLCFLLSFCNSKTSSNTEHLASDTAAIRKGQTIFAQQCGACHNFRRDGIGPQLGGILSSVSSDWVAKFVKNPQSVIEAGDERAHLLFEKYKTVMPSFQHMSEED